MNMQQAGSEPISKAQAEAIDKITAWYDTRLGVLLDLDARARELLTLMTVGDTGGKTLVLIAEVLQSIESDIKEAQKTYDDYVKVALGQKESFDFIPSLRFLLNDSEVGEGDRT